MREAIGGTWLFQIVIVFILLFTGFLCLSINRSKAFNVKDQIIQTIQSYNGIPASAFPPAVYRTAKRYYPNALIYKAERDNGRFELKLNNMMEIYISGSGAFLGREYDD